MDSPISPNKTPSSSRVTLHQLMQPEHSNGFGAIHGGTLMKLVDEAGAIAAMRHAQRPCVTIAIDSMPFHSPVHIGELVRCTATVQYVGTTSMEVGVTVQAENAITGKHTHTNSAFVVYVALDEAGRPCKVPGLVLESDADRRVWEEGRARQVARTSKPRSDF